MGRRVSEHVRLADGFQLTFCNPYACHERRNLVLYGPVGSGKRHLAIETGLRACEFGMMVKFNTLLIW
ncbi:ATP-binding protein [Paenibacillus athensensis]|uniref:ATP-binding protein n=1 Tax=Paenibacillus athensensis TaxID=1967502 RepID=UPI00143184F1|nr:ATP-binding protein [Paenibacillus athensensis]MCD1257660.1 ATP-binding protein [Paenibacillus athensensis]